MGWTEAVQVKEAESAVSQKMASRSRPLLTV